jgi:hypothetical protein
MRRRSADAPHRSFNRVQRTVLAIEPARCTRIYTSGQFSGRDTMFDGQSVSHSTRAIVPFSHEQRLIGPREQVTERCRTLRAERNTDTHREMNHRLLIAHDTARNCRSKSRRRFTRLLASHIGHHERKLFAASAPEQTAPANQWPYHPGKRTEHFVSGASAIGAVPPAGTTPPG